MKRAVDLNEFAETITPAARLEDSLMAIRWRSISFSAASVGPKSR
jgi:hypothetical protein